MVPPGQCNDLGLCPGLVALQSEQSDAVKAAVAICRFCRLGLITPGCRVVGCSKIAMCALKGGLVHLSRKKYFHITHCGVAFNSAGMFSATTERAFGRKESALVPLFIAVSLTGAAIGGFTFPPSGRSHIHHFVERADFIGNIRRKPAPSVYVAPGLYQAPFLKSDYGVAMAVGGASNVAQQEIIPSVHAALVQQWWA